MRESCDRNYVPQAAQLARGFDLLEGPAIAFERATVVAAEARPPIPRSQAAPEVIPKDRWSHQNGFAPGIVFACRAW